MKTDSRPLKTSAYQVAGLDCPDEIAELKAAFQDIDGVTDLSFNLMRGTMTVTHDPGQIEDSAIRSRVARTGMQARPVAAETGPPNAPAGLASGPLWATVISGAMTAAGLGLTFAPGAAFHETTVFAAAAYAVAILSAWRYILPKAWSAVARRRLDMNTLMTIAVIGAIALGEWFEAASVAFLFMLSHLLETWSVNRARRAIARLMEISPQQARVIHDDHEHMQPVGDVAVDQRVRVKPGEKFPLDGVITDGATTVNQAPITGESLPVAKSADDEVFAGTINEDGTVIFRVTKPADDTVLAGIIRLVEQAQSQRSRMERFVDQFAAYYTPAVVVGAVLIGVGPPLVFGLAWADWIYRALVLLVIACPCALVISTPVSVVSALASAARNGVLVKGGEFLEAIGKLHVLAIDKTGTLTVGRPVVQDAVPLDGVSRTDLLGIAVGIERESEHPIGRAIVEYGQTQGVEGLLARDYQAIRGKGAQATVEGRDYLLGNHRLLEQAGVCTPAAHRLMLEHEDCDHTVVALASREKPLGVFLVADEPRREAPSAVAALRAAGVHQIVMLTGDNAGTAKAIAAACGDIDYRAELLPADKVHAIEELRRERGGVIMVGDGVNDAPALAAANVGIAMGAAGTDVALETADVALMTDDLGKLPWLVDHSRRTRRVIIENIVLALAIKAVFLVLAVFNLANLWMAIAADMGASLVVIANALRLLHARGNTTSDSLTNKEPNHG
jgi:Cd2+/Zn2+-exporting ATPase